MGDNEEDDDSDNYISWRCRITEKTPKYKKKKANIPLPKKKANIPLPKCTKYKTIEARLRMTIKLNC